MNAFQAILSEHEASVDRHDRPCLIDSRTYRSFSWRETANLVVRVSHHLKSLGMASGEGVVSILPNSLESLVLFFACARNGYTYAPLGEGATSGEIGALCKAVSAKVIFTTPFLIADQRNFISQLGLSHTQCNLDSRFEWLDGIDLQDSVAEAHPHAEGRLVIATSGTVSGFKLICWDMAELIETARSFVSAYPVIDHNARFFNNLSMSYLGGLLNLGLIPFVAGATTVVGDAFSGRTTQTLWHDINRFDINILWVPPAVIRQMISDVEAIGSEIYAGFGDTVRMVLTGMAPISAPVKSQFETLFRVPLLENYALSETGFISGERMETPPRTPKPGHVGHPFDGVDIRFVETDDHASEIAVRSPHMFSGYIGQDGKLDSARDEDGFLRAGDAGFLAEDGQLILEGRLRDIVKRGDLIIHLDEIVDLAQSNPDIGSAAAIRTEHRVLGEGYELFILKRAEKISSDDETIATWIRKMLPQQKWPNEIRFVDNLPMTRSGKIKKSSLREESRSA